MGRANALSLSSPAYLPVLEGCIHVERECMWEGKYSLPILPSPLKFLIDTLCKEGGYVGRAQMLSHPSLLKLLTSAVGIKGATAGGCVHGYVCGGTLPNLTIFHTFFSTSVNE